MLVVLDSNVFFSALISPGGAPHRIYEAWRQGDFNLVTCEEQLEELRRASRYPKFKGILQPHLVGLMLNHLQRTTVFDRVPAKHTAKDPHDSYLLDLADFASVHHLVTGDKRAGLIELKRIGTASILTATAFCKLLS